MPTKKIIDKVKYSVAAIIFNDKNEILMFDRKGKEWETGWEFIKGAIHNGETEEHAVLREIKEEAGPIKVKKIGKLKEYFWTEMPYKKGKLKIKGRIFVFKYIKGNIKLGEKEHIGYKWMNIKEAKKKIWIKKADLLIKKADKLFLANYSKSTSVFPRIKSKIYKP